MKLCNKIYDTQLPVLTDEIIKTPYSAGQCRVLNPLFPGMLLSGYSMKLTHAFQKTPCLFQ